MMVGAGGRWQRDQAAKLGLIRSPFGPSSPPELGRPCLSDEIGCFAHSNSGSGNPRQQPAQPQPGGFQQH